VPAFGTANTALKANWGNKDGQSTSTDPNAGYRLSFDGVWIHNTLADIPYTNGGAFCLIISNLSAGAHTVTTYHNEAWGNHVNTPGPWHGTNHFMSGCVISVDGAMVLTNTLSYYATSGDVTNNYMDSGGHQQSVPLLSDSACAVAAAAHSAGGTPM
jgi:hypothetical protein